MYPESVENLLSSLAADKENGASTLFHKAMPLFPVLASEIEEERVRLPSLLRDLAVRLRLLQPCMAPFHQLSEYVEQLREQKLRPKVVAAAFRALPHATQRTWRKQLVSMNTEAHAQFSDVRRVLVHSRSGLVEQFLKSWLRASPDREVWITESRPGQEGLALASALADLPNRRVLLADDARWLALAHVDAALLGADRISESVFVNKIGSYALARLAAERGCPLMVLADGLKFLPEGLPALPERNHSISELGVEFDGAEPFNYYFEPVPVGLVSRFITPYGSLQAGDLPALFDGGTWRFYSSRTVPELTSAVPKVRGRAG